MIRTHLYTFNNTPHPFQESLEQQLCENGHQLVDASDAQVILCMGEGLQGFDEIGLQQVEQQLQERFLGAELLYKPEPFLLLEFELATTNTVNSSLRLL